jgi:subtilase family serine protease
MFPSKAPTADLLKKLAAGANLQEPTRWHHALHKTQQKAEKEEAGKRGERTTVAIVDANRNDIYFFTQVVGR